MRTRFSQAAPDTPGTSKFRGLILMLGIPVLALGLTVIVNGLGLDPVVSGWFYDPGASDNGWFFGDRYPWWWLYEYGEFPGAVFSVFALIGWIASRRKSAWAQYRKPFLAVILTVVLGPGLIVNGVCKEFLGRPRPADTEIFGGNAPYRAALDPGRPGEGKSFPCGHCSMGFAFSSGVAFYPWFPAAGMTALVFGAIYGSLSSVARIVQGGHYPTDVIWAAAIVYTLILALYYFILRIPDGVDGRRYTNSRRMDS